MSFRIVCRKEWNARQAGFVPNLPIPVSNVMVNYTRKSYERGKQSPGPRPNTDAVIEELQYLQKGDLFRFPDIRYNFLVGADGQVYEGRGWLAVPTTPLKFNKLAFKSLFIGFIGDFKDVEPPEIIFEKTNELIKFGVDHKFIQRKFHVWYLCRPENYTLDFTKYIRM